MLINFYKGKWDEIAEQFHNKNQKNISLEYSLKIFQNLLVKNSRNFISKKIIKLFQDFISLYFSRKLDKNLKTFLKTYVKLYGIKKNELFALYSFPDFLTYIFSKTPAIKIPHLDFGCSSVVKINNKSIIHGRNLDYFGGNIWAKNHEIVVLMPESAQKSINILSKGYFSPGITSLNESLLSFSVHMLYTSEVNFYGEPILSLLFKLINNAYSIAEVRKILENSKPITGWGIIVCDHKVNKAYLFELTGKNLKELQIDKNFAYVNMYMTALKEKEFLFSYAWIQNNFGRYRRLLELLNKNFRCEDILSDKFDIFLGDNKLGGTTIANNFTVSSAIFNVKEDNIAVADNLVPASIGIYRNYSICGLFKGNIVEKEISIAKNAEKINRTDFYILINGYDKLLIDWDIKKFIKSLEKLECNYLKYLFLSICYAKINKFDKAIKEIEKINIKLDRYREGSIYLLKGILYDLTQQRDMAIKIYKKIILKYNYPDLTFHAITFLKAPFKKDKLKFIDINLFLSHYILLL